MNIIFQSFMQRTKKLIISLTIRGTYCQQINKYSTAQKKVTTLSRDANRVARYAIPVAQGAILVARDGLKTVSTFVSLPKFFSDFKKRW